MAEEAWRRRRDGRGRDGKRRAPRGEGRGARLVLLRREVRARHAIDVHAAAAVRHKDLVRHVAVRLHERPQHVQRYASHLRAREARRGRRGRAVRVWAGGAR